MVSPRILFENLIPIQSNTVDSSQKHDPQKVLDVFSLCHETGKTFILNGAFTQRLQSSLFGSKSIMYFNTKHKKTPRHPMSSFLSVLDVFVHSYKYNTHSLPLSFETLFSHNNCMAVVKGFDVYIMESIHATLLQI